MSDQRQTPAIIEHDFTPVFGEAAGFAEFPSIRVVERQWDVIIDWNEPIPQPGTPYDKSDPVQNRVRQMRMKGHMAMTGSTIEVPVVMTALSTGSMAAFVTGSMIAVTAGMLAGKRHEDKPLSVETKIKEINHKQKNERLKEKSFYRKSNMGAGGAIAALFDEPRRVNGEPYFITEKDAKATIAALPTRHVAYGEVDENIMRIPRCEIEMLVANIGEEQAEYIQTLWNELLVVLQDTRIIDAYKDEDFANYLASQNDGKKLGFTPAALVLQLAKSHKFKDAFYTIAPSLDYLSQLLSKEHEFDEAVFQQLFAAETTELLEKLLGKHTSQQTDFAEY